VANSAKTCRRMASGGVLKRHRFDAKAFDKDQLAEIADGATMARQIVEFGIGSVVRVDRNGWLAGGKQRTA